MTTSINVTAIIPRFFKHLSATAATVIIAASFFTSPVLAEAVKADTPAKPAAVQQAGSVQQDVAAKGESVNINTADAQTLADRLNGVGIKKAEAIVAYRTQNGAFKAPEDIINVAGIGEAILAKNKDIISVN